MSLALSGIGVSRGIAIGKAHVLQRGSIEVLESALPPDLIENEVERFLQAVHNARQQLESLRERIPPGTRADIAAFIDTHRLMLDDATLVTTPVELIRERGCNAEWALKLQRDAVVEVFDRMDDPYLRTRRDEVDHVINSILRTLLETVDNEPHADADALDQAIVLADNLTPAETVLLEHQGIAGFATAYGGPLSHTAILARSMQIPAIVGAYRLQDYIHDGETVILDGMQGVLIAGPDANMLQHYRERQQQEQQRRLDLSRLADTPAVSRDEIPITLMANIELPEDIQVVRQSSASGVGLYRTEFLFMNRIEPPGEDEQYEVYLSVIDALGGRPLTIRTLDMGADKHIGNGRTPVCNNPALGLRAIRLCLKDLSLFRPQLRAILRASAHGPVRMMIPMLSNTHELHQILSLVNETRNALQRESHAFAPDLPVGGMIEVPAAALTAADFARHLDFLSIGTNDLIQYTLAIDRIDEEVTYLYDPLHPAVLKLIKMTIDAGRAAGIPVGMCGEMAGDPRYTRLLLGLGLREFSMHHSALQEVKNVINTSTISKLEPLVAELLNNTESGRIPGRVDSLNQDLH
ncbi:MAG: phosphoenolpyruvate--protein phosphotransferase [Gammaproteobacteria bacterium]|jgi:phosphotransferase system enzyme I (PtsI)